MRQSNTHEKDGDGDERDDWIIDDDGAGYTEGTRSGVQKRPTVSGHYESATKRPRNELQLQPTFQSGSTPWKNS
jgi:chromosome transmission fidelity protein 4